MLVANDPVERPAKLGQRQRISRRSVINEKNFTIGLENLADTFDEAPRPFVFAIGCGLVAVRFGESSPGLRANRRSVIALEFVSIHRTAHREFPTRLCPAERQL